MGCSNVSGHNRPQNIKVDFKQEMTDVGKVDELFTGAFEILKKVERIRKTLSVRWNKVLRLSGAIVIKEPGLKHIFWGSLWKISHDMMNLKNVADLVRITASHPYVKIESPQNLETQNVKDIGESLKNFFIIAFEMKDDVPSIIDSVKKYFEDLQEAISNPEKLFEGANLGVMEMAKAGMKLKTNVSKIAKGKKVIEAIGNILMGTAKDLPELIKSLQDVDRMKEVYNVGEKARKNKWDTAPRIVWENDKDEKAVKKFEDYTKLVEEDEANERAVAASNAAGEDHAPEPNDKGMINEERPENPARDESKDHGAADGKKKVDEKTAGANPNPQQQEQIKSLEHKVKVMEQENKELHEKLDKLMANSNGSTNTHSVNPLPVIICKQSPLKSAQLLMKKSISTRGEVPARVLESVPDQNMLAFGNEHGVVSIIDSESLDDVHNFSASHKGPVTTLCYLSDGDTILSGGADGQVISHSISSKSSSPLVQEKSDIEKIIYAQDGSTVYISCGNKVTAYNVLNKTAKFSHEKKSKITALHFLRSHHLLFIGSLNSLSAYNVQKGEVVKEISGKGDYEVTDITSYSHKGVLHLAYVESDTESHKATVVVYDYNEHSEHRRKELHIKHCKNLIYCHDHKTVIAVSSEKDNGVFVLYNTKNESKKSLSTRGAAFNSIQYLGGEYALALSTDDGSIDFWTYAK